LQKQAGLNVILGPPNCGKTTLLNHVLEREQKEGRIALMALDFR